MSATNEYLRELALYAAPGIVSVLSYWFVWRVRRRVKDYVGTFIIFIFMIRALGRVVRWGFIVIFGDPMMFGTELGPVVPAVSLALSGVGLAVFMGRWLRDHGDDEGTRYPWYPIPVK